ncbi:hypothetical protein Fmac_011210 [Flemingia macrophylla]|uniref:Uncharacterized protein n=1 Tax=Flemingia macrophylla TaxID=520843 RepID=A0ABD1MLT1_9FABA
MLESISRLFIHLCAIFFFRIALSYFLKFHMKTLQFTKKKTLKRNALKIARCLLKVLSKKPLKRTYLFACFAIYFGMIIS